MAIYICKSGSCSYVTGCDEEKFCMICGKPLLSACAKCGAKIKRKEQRFCYECGEGLKDDSLLTNKLYSMNNLDLEFTT